MPETILVYDIKRTLQQRQGVRTRKELAAEIGVSEAYLSRVMNDHDDPGPKVLRYLGLEKLETVNQYRAVK